MGKRRLNRRQAWRIDKVQQERLRRAERRAARVARAPSGLGPEQTGRVIANYGAFLDVETAGGGEVSRCVPRRNVEPVAGDEVVWQPGAEPGTGVVTAVAPRRTVLARGAGNRERPIAANVDRILVVIAPRPLYSTELVDQYTVAAEHAGITPVLVFNKADLLDKAARAKVETMLQIYAEVGYRTLLASTRAEPGLDALQETLRGRTSVFVGQSGVGKSSLVGALVPDEEVRVGELSDGQGRHTTSTARLYHLPGRSRLIDSPGVREFGLGTMGIRELADGFAEFRPWAAQCRFRNCTHLQEPGCAVREAVASGAIHPSRFDSYARLVRGMPEQSDDQS